MAPVVTWATPPDAPATIQVPAVTAPASASPDAPLAAAGSDSETALRQALNLERQRNWSAAIEAYQRAADQWPDQPQFTQRKRLCEAHYRLGRRYQDQSFRKVLLQLPRERAVALYDEILERIDLNYVDAVPLEPLLRRGYDNMEVALRDPAFLKTNQVATAAPGRLSSARA